MPESAIFAVGEFGLEREEGESRDDRCQANQHGGGPHQVDRDPPPLWVARAGTQQLLLHKGTIASLGSRLRRSVRKGTSGPVLGYLRLGYLSRRLRPATEAPGP